MRLRITTILIGVVVLLCAAAPCRAELANVNFKSLLKYEDFMSEQISLALDLSGERRARFEEIYRASIRESRESRGSDRTQLDMTDLQSMSDDEIEAKILLTFELSHKMLSIREKYYRKLREIFSAREVAMIYEIERRSRIKFQEELMRRRSEANMEH